MVLLIIITYRLVIIVNIVNIANKVNNVIIVELDSSCLVKYVNNVNVTLSGLYIPVSHLRKTQVDKPSYRSQTH